ncbi:glycosyltransferase [Pseudonocardia oroxyli]|uniref:Glycosyltransferase involved in cell wall bisynthesis n=1 Tax=Pseudonocardia oroxyli TaxID=366584 RepID=A0A1G7XRW1_PSEOR|nr:glycosyltransferase [Pseudonocardia oroxyli]SDG86874.1 Glycosyltransferase involved in cell wall bisynthesis [Pseudonocardia oroxyli]
MVQGGADPLRDGVADYTEHLAGALTDAGEDLLRVSVSGSLPSVLRAARILRTRRPEVVHVQFAPSAFRFRPWIGLLPVLVGAPVVTTVHEYGWWAWPDRAPNRAWRVLDRRGVDRETWLLVPRSAAVLATNAGHQQAIRERSRVLAARVPLAPNVADRATEPRGVTRRRLGLPDDAVVVVFFGFVHPVKGVRYLADAIARVGARHTERLHLLVVGGFTSQALPEDEARAFRDELLAEIAATGVPATITGHLPEEQVSAALHAADLAAFPLTAGVTTKSGALLSAWAHGLPTVVTAADPPDPELVDGETVVVARAVRDGEALAVALRRLLDDPTLRLRVAAGGAAAGATRSWERLAEVHRKLYAEVRAGA